MWLTQDSQRATAFILVLSILLAYITSFVQSIPLAATQEPDLNVTFLQQYADGYNGSGTLAKRLVIGGMDLGGDPSTPSWASRQNTGRRLQMLIHVYMLWCLMKNRDAIQSIFTFPDLARYGWEADEFDGESLQVYRDNIAPLYSDSEFAFNDKNDQGWGNLQLLDWKNNGQSVLPTCSGFQNIYNGPQGYIVACANVSPAASGAEELPPPLQKWSDVSALQWQSVAAGQQLNYIVRRHVNNWNTRMCIYSALRDAGQATLPTWPGVDFTIKDDGTGPLASGFLGLLGTYHGAGGAYMLAQHRSIFGQKTITKIRIWDEKNAWPISGDPLDQRYMSPNMLMWVDDVVNSE
ncbi:hypothetical protein F4777DRAFT_584156 [Nemania sp. FL0916]|nr:hypothetical protein F4777DRAFT_584156 [Nemania sp. FL0916]